MVLGDDNDLVNPADWIGGKIPYGIVSSNWNNASKAGLFNVNVNNAVRNSNVNISSRTCELFLENIAPLPLGKNIRYEVGIN